ncbi:Palmitoyltransferase [Apophysomyces ossiformis]|uniref:Palmitoyltransferase n=1 Tax=Apophysomyces ossiformis TaxID=679940 RepID=A0A8H7EQN3_9FUNG|nr:Palmitoyltransferase [Apophysomyces ossiformis]
MTSLKERQGQCIVASVIILITFVAYTSQIFVLWHFLGGPTLHTAAVLLPFNVFVILIYINYALTCLTEPGSVPKNWMPEQHIHVEVKRSTHAPRFCKTCNNYKPPRTHHCRACGRCVLKMDHHCPWINNCVGFANYGHFLRFLFYVDIGTIYLFVLLSCRLAQMVWELRHNDIRPSVIEVVFLSINYALSALVMVAVGILSGYHVYCVTTNTTTIEGWEKGRSLTMRSMGKIQNVKYPYDHGMMNNLRTVLGPQPLWWFWPQRMTGTGLDFPINAKHVYEEQEDDLEDDLPQRLSSYSHETLRSIMTSTTAAVPPPLPNPTVSIPKRVSVIEPERIRTKPSTLRLKKSTSLIMPNTPGSVMTFASTSTLVDPHVRASTPEQYEMNISSQ